jgi:hypothetical protein
MINKGFIQHEKVVPTTSQHQFHGRKEEKSIGIKVHAKYIVPGNVLEAQTRLHMKSTKYSIKFVLKLTQ